MTLRWLTIAVPTAKFMHMLDIVFLSNNERMVRKTLAALAQLQARVAQGPASLFYSPTWPERRVDLIVLHHDALTHASEMFPKDGPCRNDTPSIAIIPDHLIAGAATLLDAGFDRCLPESFDAGHLAAMARALTRRSHGLTSSVSLYGPLSFNHDNKRAHIDGAEIELTAREVQVLEILLIRMGQIISKEDFVRAIDPNNMELNSSAIEVYIHRLRKKIGNDVLPIRNIKRCGYFLRRFSYSHTETNHDSHPPVTRTV
jgi:DNA-binding winged helix-turn-helix (wHTH) protein